MFGSVTVSSLCYLPKCFMWVTARKFEMWGVGHGRTGKNIISGAKREQRQWFNMQELWIPTVLEFLENPRPTWTFHCTWWSLLEFQRGWELTWTHQCKGTRGLGSMLRQGPESTWLLCGPLLPRDVCYVTKRRWSGTERQWPRLKVTGSKSYEKERSEKYLRTENDLEKKKTTLTIIVMDNKNLCTENISFSKAFQ